MSNYSKHTVLILKLWHSIILPVNDILFNSKNGELLLLKQPCHEVITHPSLTPVSIFISSVSITISLTLTLLHHIMLSLPLPGLPADVAVCRLGSH